MRDKVFITGASGFIGAAVARRLLAAGYEVHALARPDSPRKNFEGLNLRVHAGDILDAASLERAMQGCRYVFHVAAHYKLFNRPASLPYRVNVEGTRNVLGAARRLGVERAVYTSSVSTVGICPRRGIGHEETPLDPAYVVGHYKKSKVLAEQEALRWARDGLDVVIVNPAAPIGQGDVKPTPTGRIVLEYLRGRMAGYLDTGLNVVDVEDVAAGHLSALSRGRKAERYILGHRNMPLLEIFQMLQKITGVPAPRWKVPYGLALAAGLVGQTVARFTGKDPVATLDAVRMARKKMYFDSGKAIRELGLPQSPVENAFERAVHWFADSGYLKSGSSFFAFRETVDRRKHETAIAR